jgi:hypothetical protein
MGQLLNFSFMDLDQSSYPTKAQRCDVCLETIRLPGLTYVFGPAVSWSTLTPLKIFVLLFLPLRNSLTFLLAQLLRD